MVAIAGLLVIGIPFIGKLGLGGGDRRRRRRRLRAHDPADHDRRADAAGCGRRSPSTCGRRPPSSAGASWSPRARGSRSPPASWSCSSSPRPVTQLRLGQPDDGNQPESKTQRVAYDQLSRGVRRRLQRPVPARRRHPEGRGGDRGAAHSSSQHAVGETPGIATVAPADVSQDGEMATIFAIPTTAPQDAKTSDLLERLRDDVIPARDGRHAAEGLRRRQHGRLRGLLGQGRLAAAAVHRRRDRPLGAAADRGLPLAVDPARLGGVQPAVGRRRLRRRGRASSRRASARA